MHRRLARVLVVATAVGSMAACSPEVDLTKEERATGVACVRDAPIEPVRASGAPPFTTTAASFGVPGLSEVLGLVDVDGVQWMMGEGDVIGQHFLVAQDTDGAELARWRVPGRPFGLHVVDGYAITQDLETGVPMRIALDTGDVTVADPVAGEPADMQVSPDGRRAYLTLNLLGEIAVVDLQTGRTVCEVPVVSGGNSPKTLSGDGIRIFRGFSGGGGSTYHAGLEVLDRQTGETLDLVESGSPVDALALSPDESTLAGLSYRGDRLFIIDPVTLTTTAEVRLPGEGDAIHWHDGYAYVRAFGPGAVWVVDVQVREVVATIDVPFLAYDVAFTDDAAFVVGEQVVAITRKS